MTLSTDELLARIRREESERLGREPGQKGYRATDPASRYVKCNCGHATCWTAGLLPLRAHMAALFQAITSLGFAERFPGADREDEPWPGVTYALQMAGGVSDLVCDPSYVYDDSAAFYCESAAEREDEDRELASKYAAALITFNFAWAAYEAAIEITSNEEPIKGKLPVHARNILHTEASDAAKIRSLEQCYRYARKHCMHQPFLKNQIVASEAKYDLSGPPAAAELVRIFRNYVIHGNDTLPAESIDPCYRFYAVTRVVILLTQYLVLRRVIRPSRPVPLSVNRDEIGREPASLFLRNLHYEDNIWRTAIPKRPRYGGRPTRWYSA